MALKDVIDRCGMRVLILLICWVGLGSFGAPAYVHILSSVGAALCVVGMTEAFLPSREKRSAYKPPVSFRLREFARAALSRDNARRFMIVALILLGFSFFIPFSVWYYVLIGVNVLATVLCLAFGNR